MTFLQSQLRTTVSHNFILSDGNLRIWEKDWRPRTHGMALASVRPAETAWVTAPASAGSTLEQIQLLAFKKVPSA